MEIFISTPRPIKYSVLKQQALGPPVFHWSVPQGRQVLPEQQDLRARLERQAQRERQDRLDLLVLLEQPVPQVQPDRLDQRELLDQLD